MMLFVLCLFFFFFNDTATTEIYTLSLHDALPISRQRADGAPGHALRGAARPRAPHVPRPRRGGAPMPQRRRSALSDDSEGQPGRGRTARDREPREPHLQLPEGDPLDAGAAAHPPHRVRASREAGRPGLPAWGDGRRHPDPDAHDDHQRHLRRADGRGSALRSEEHTSELQSLAYLVCRLLLEKKKKKTMTTMKSDEEHVAGVKDRVL